MAKKLITGLAVLLVIFIAGIFCYAYTLHQQINRLQDNLATLELEQSDKIDNLEANINSLQNETLDKLNTLEEKIEEALTALATVRDETAVLADDILGITSGLATLDERLTAAEGKLAASTIDISAIFEQVSRTTVRISDGQLTRGSGVIMDTEGHVLTARHVVDGLASIYVITYDGLVSRATIVGACKFSDIAVLQLDKDPGIAPPPFADSSLITIGQPVVAIGAPFESSVHQDMRDTLTAGVISQLDRYVNVDGTSIPNLLQFDAPVNFGNSGGPLFSAEGEIAGIVIARIHPTEGDGIYFAVSANKASRVAAEIIENGFFDHPWLGVIIEEITPREVYNLELETVNGVFVKGVFSGSPAEVAGITADDIIRSINGVSIRDIAALTSYLAEYTSPGDVVILGIQRSGTAMEIPVELGSRE
jgi:S1-C subfamily serine protease